LKNTNAVLQEQLVWLSFIAAENGHGEHCAAPLRENVLLPHSMHLSGPSVVLYVPGTHAMHAWPFAPVYPALHWQSVASSLPARAFEFNGQLEHVGTT
jgi:hypothetical protein